MICPICGEIIPDKSKFCNMCGVKIEDALVQVEREKKEGKRPLISKEIATEFGMKRIDVYCSDITAFTEQIDLLTVSAFTGHYEPTPRTVIHALLEKKGISVEMLAEKPMLDLREACGCWISDAVPENKMNDNIHRVGCVELVDLEDLINNTCGNNAEEHYFRVLKSYFHLVDILADTGAAVKTVATPILGAGRQGLDMELIKIPLVNEAIGLLRRNANVERIVFIERSMEKAEGIAKTLTSMYQLTDSSSTVSQPNVVKSDEPYVFISYSTNGDSEMAEQLSDYLTHKNIKTWFAPSDIMTGDYAEAIYDGINRCTHFVCLISSRSMRSQHVLNEIDLAFHRVSEGVTIIPMMLEKCEMRPSFRYYLARMQHVEGSKPPIQERFEDLACRITQRKWDNLNE